MRQGVCVSEINALVEAAILAANQGRWNDAEAFWTRVLALDPRHPQALYTLGVHAFKRGQLPEALHALQAAHAAAPQDPVVLLSIGVVLREQGDSAGELRAIDAALAADPYFLAGLLAKASCLERQGMPKAATAVYRNALKVAPEETRWPPALRSQLLHARSQVERMGIELAAFLADRIGTRASALTPTESQRWREAGAILSGRSQPYYCAKMTLFSSSMAAAMAKDQGEFQPYIAYQPGVPVNQWQELNHSRRWSSYFLWRNGEPQPGHLQQCPETARALAEIDMADIGGLCPNAMFSALAPHTQIPPHHGETNARVIVHLPLVVPEHCLYRVGFEQRRWKVGEVLVFDDSIEHEARNDSDELRVVLIFDVWNPLLSPGEREMVRALSAATREFQRQG